MYLYNFTRYIQWPSSSNSEDFVIGVFGNSDELVSELKDIATKRTIGTKKMVVSEFKSVRDVQPCQIIFVPKNKMGDFDQIADKVASYSTLIVTEDSSFPTKSAINLVFDGSKLKYDVNVKNATAAGLKVSDKLIAVSK